MYQQHLLLNHLLSLIRTLEIHTRRPSGRLQQRRDYSSPVYDSGPTINLTSHTVGTPLAGSTTYYWRVRHQDNKGVWFGYSTETSFATTLGGGGGPRTLILHPSDAVSSGGFATTGGSWSNILDNNNGDTSYAYYGAGPGGQIFYVNMDDPTGLGSATINNITIYVYARYLDGPWPGAVPYAGSVNIGYKTGAVTVWKGSVSTDTSGAYNLIISSAYTTDSDGGSLSLSDINNLQIAVKRETYGPPVLCYVLQRFTRRLTMLHDPLSGL